MTRPASPLDLDLDTLAGLHHYTQRTMGRMADNGLELAQIMALPVAELDAELDASAETRQASARE